MKWVNTFSIRKKSDEIYREQSIIKSLKRSEEPNKGIKELKEQLNKIENMLEELKSKPIEYHVNIEQVDVHNPKLDNLTFELDKLDIKELSGALTIGNNFGMSVMKKDDKKKKDQKEEKDKKDKDNQKKEEDCMVSDIKEEES